MDICPSCGSDAELDEYTGWCPECTGTTQYKQSAVKKCVRCSSAFISPNGGEFICAACKTERWANSIEELMAQYRLSYSRAKELIAIDNQATCLCCGDSMPRATKGRHLFCSKPKCKSASRRVKHLRLGKGMEHDEALSQVLQEVHAAA